MYTCICTHMHIAVHVQLVPDLSLGVSNPSTVCMLYIHHMHTGYVICMCMYKDTRPKHNRTYMYMYICTNTQASTIQWQHYVGMVFLTCTHCTCTYMHM